MTNLPAEVRDLIEAANYAHLATILPDGGPHTVPVWIGLEGSRIAFLTSPRSRKASNIKRDPRVAISITDHAKPYVMGLIRGRVVECLDGNPAWTIIDRLSDQYLGQPYPLRSDRVVYLIEADHARSINYG
jgi:PPOX class probable F420-dependent enzyme